MAQRRGGKGGGTSFDQMNPYQQSSRQLNAANSGYAHGMFYQPMQLTGGANSAAGAGSTIGGGAVTSSGNYGYDPAQAAGITQPAPSYASQTLQNTDLSGYMNPYTNEVINNSIADMERARQVALNNTGASAGAAGAYGGGRHGVMEANTNADAIRSMGSMSANLRNLGFQNSQQMALTDIGNKNQASQFNIGNEQAQRMANLQNRQYNTGAQNQASQFEQQSALQQAMNNANNRQQSGIVARQLASNERLADQKADQWAAQFRLGAADNMQNLGLANFGLGNTIQQNNQAQGNFERMLQQQILDRAQQQFQGYTQSPYQGMDVLNTAFNPSGQNSVSKNPGLFDYLGMGLGAAGVLSDRRAKEQIRKIGKWFGHNLYVWKWRQEALDSGLPMGPEVGVIAQEVMETHPDAVTRTPSGYLVVDYGALS